MGRAPRALVVLVTLAVGVAVAVCAIPGCHSSAAGAPVDAGCVKATSPDALLAAGTCYCDVNAKLMDPMLTCSEQVVASPGFCIRGASEPTKGTAILCARSPDGATYVTDIPLNYVAFGDGWSFTEFGGIPANTPVGNTSSCAKLAWSLQPYFFSGGIPGCGIGGGPPDGFCPVSITLMDIVEVMPPKDNTQGSCTDTELTKVTGMFSAILEAVSPTCASCLFTEANDMTNTQFFVWADTMHVNVSLENFGTCMGSPLSGGSAGCGKAAEEIESCLEAACPRDAIGLSTCSITYDECAMEAVAMDCKAYDDKQTAACGGTAALKAIKDKCFDGKGAPDPGIKLLCGGGGVTDAGADGD